MRKIISSIFITIILIYFMIKTTSPKVIFLPFLICSISAAGESIAMLMGKKKLATVFSKSFAAGFFLLWFGAIAIGAYISMRDKNYGILFLLIPFLLAGIYMARRKLLGEKPNDNAVFNAKIIISGLLVVIALLAGILLMFLGVKRQEGALIFMGVFFVLGATAFIVGALTINGKFDHCRIDVLGLYVGIVFVIVGIGFFVLAYQNTAGGMKVVLAIPTLMTVAGVLQVLKCFKNRE